MSKYPELDEDGNPYPDDDIDLDTEIVLDSQGRRITTEYVERAVQEAHERARMGRPSLTGENIPSPRLSFRLTPELEAAAKARAKQDGVQVSDVARTALQEYLGADRG